MISRYIDNPTKKTRFGHPLRALVGSLAPRIAPRIACHFENVTKMPSSKKCGRSDQISDRRRPDSPDTRYSAQMAASELSDVTGASHLQSSPSAWQRAQNGTDRTAHTRACPARSSLPPMLHRLSLRAPRPPRQVRPHHLRRLPGRIAQA